MARTEIRGGQVLDGSIKRKDLNIDNSENAVIRKIIAGNNITISSTGAASGTGDVTINAIATGEGGSGAFLFSEQTTDNVERSLAEFEIAENTTESFLILVTGRGPSNKNYWANIQCTARRNVSEGSFLVGDVVITEDDENEPEYIASADTSGNNLRIRVTGKNSETVQWYARAVIGSEEGRVVDHTSFHGQISNQTSQNVTITDTGVFVPMEITGTFDTTNSFGMEGDGFGVKNTSGTKRLFVVIASADVEVGNVKTTAFRLAVNGVGLPETVCTATTGTQNFAKLFSQWMVELEDGDVVSCEIANNTNTDNINVVRSKIVAFTPGTQNSGSETGTVFPEIVQQDSGLITDMLAVAGASETLISDLEQEIVIPSGETWFVRFDSSISLSRSDTSLGVNVSLKLNSTTVYGAAHAGNFDTGDTSGNIGTITLTHSEILTAGTHVFEVEWGNSNRYSSLRRSQLFAIRLG
jgi:hypothetical protein